jgi:hypothetical protein
MSGMKKQIQKENLHSDIRSSSEPSSMYLIREVQSVDIAPAG